MSTKRNKSPRRTAARKGRAATSPPPVREMLLELAYRLHATRSVVVRPRAAGSVA